MNARRSGFVAACCPGGAGRGVAGEWIPCILEPEGSSKEYRKNWARLIQKIYEIDPLICPKCRGHMRILAFIDDEEVIEKILKHLGLWDLKVRPRARAL